MKKSTITIGIPAFNEEKNLAVLLNDLLRQKTQRTKIAKILVASDGSIDKTVAVARQFQNRKVQVIANRRRMGKSVRLNQIMSQAKSDVLILLDADISIPDPYFVEKMARPIAKDGYDLVSGKIRETAPETLVERVIFASMQFKNLAFENYRNGRNLYTCRGPARALSRQLYQKMRFRRDLTEDMYSYLYCVKNGFRYSYESSVVAYYKLPGTIADHAKQSVRFFTSTRWLKHEFGEEFVSREARWPKFYLAYYGLKVFPRYPLEIIAYPFLTIMMNVLAQFRQTAGRSNRWQMVLSSKKLGTIL